MSSNADSSTKAVLSAITGNVVITIIKSVGWVFTQSPSMLAESIHSFADSCNQLLLYVGIRKSKKGPSQAFPMG